MKVIPFQDISTVQGELQRSPFIHPTNSCYGIGGSIYSQEIYDTIYSLKDRPHDKPFFITVKDIAMLSGIAQYHPSIDEFTELYPDTIFTFILNRDSALPGYINPGFTTVGVQIATGYMSDILAYLDTPIFGTSANISGDGPIYTSDEIVSTFRDYDIIFLDGGDLIETPPSTIIDLTGETPKILRGDLN